MFKRLVSLFALIVLVLLAPGSPAGSVSAGKPPTPTPTPPPGPATPLQIYGAWHCGNDACTWSAVRTVSEFDSQNHWLVDRGDGRPSVNLVVLSFVHPLKLLNQTTDAGTLNGVPRGMTPEIVAARPGWDAVPAVRDGELHEIKSPLILQPGPAALTDGLDALHAIVRRWALLRR